MSVYAAICHHPNQRKAKHIFRYENGTWFDWIRFSSTRKRMPALRLDSGDRAQPYWALLSYAEQNHIDELEIALFDDGNESLLLFAKFAQDKDISLGLLFSHLEALESKRDDLDELGIAYVDSRSFSSERIAHSCPPLESGAPKFDFGFSFLAAGRSPIAKGKKPAGPTIPGETPSYEPSEKTFHEQLLDHLRASGKTDPEIYKAAGVSRQVFSKIISSPNMIPKKDTIVALAMGLELPYGAALQLVEAGGFTLSRSLKKDMIIRSYFQQGNYDVRQLNEELNEYGYPLLGWNPRE